MSAILISVFFGFLTALALAVLVHSIPVLLRSWHQTRAQLRALDREMAR